MNCSIPSHVSVTCSGSPEVSSTAFCAQPPNLRSAFLIDMGFAIICPLAPTLTPQIRFLYIGSRICSTLPSDSASRRRPCALLSLHLYQVVKRILTFKLSNMLGTQKKARNSRARLFFHGSSAYLRKRAISPVKKDPKPSRLSSGRMEAVCGRPFALPCP